jgi:prepilin-type N-terminal cleavage/methylation domain-containing protein
MKKAFTMIELIIVIVVIGILATLAIPRMYDSRLQEAADQVVAHIRYAQHLAMLDNKFIPSTSMSTENTSVKKDKNVKYWYKSLWEIMFHTTGRESPTYSIFSDKPTSTASNASYDGNPRNSDRIARNPSNNLKMCGFDSSTSSIPDNQIDTSIRLGKRYGITTVSVSNNCQSNRFIFDEQGRPFCSTPLSSETGKYYFDKDDKLIARATIRLCINGDCKNIYIEPETGMVHF